MKHGMLLPVLTVMLGGGVPVLAETPSQAAPSVTGTKSVTLRVEKMVCGASLGRTLILTTLAPRSQLSHPVEEEELGPVEPTSLFFLEMRSNQRSETGRRRNTLNRASPGAPVDP